VVLGILIAHELWHVRSVSRAWDARLTAAAVAAQRRWLYAQGPSNQRATKLHLLRWYFSPGRYLCWKAPVCRQGRRWAPMPDLAVQDWATEKCSELNLPFWWGPWDERFVEWSWRCCAHVRKDIQCAGPACARCGTLQCSVGGALLACRCAFPWDSFVRPNYLHLFKPEWLVQRMRRLHAATSAEKSL